MYYTLYKKNDKWHTSPNQLSGIVKKFTFWALTDFCNDTIELINAESIIMSKGKKIRIAQMKRLPQMKLTFTFNN